MVRPDQFLEQMQCGCMCIAGWWKASHACSALLGWLVNKTLFGSFSEKKFKFCSLSWHVLCLLAFLLSSWAQFCLTFMWVLSPAQNFLTGLSQGDISTEEDHNEEKKWHGLRWACYISCQHHIDISCFHFTWLFTYISHTFHHHLFLIIPVLHTHHFSFRCI